MMLEGLPADVVSPHFEVNGLMKKFRIASLAIIAAAPAVALSGCAGIEDVMENESSLEFDTTDDVVAQWGTTASWLPDDATSIRIHQSTQGEPAVLLSTSTTDLDPSVCIETERRSAPAFAEDWAPESYVDNVFACGDWAVIPTETGWYGWTPNHPDEKAASLRIASE
jgi:hypothetical protein